MTSSDDIVRDWPLEYGFESTDIQACDGTRLRLVTAGPEDGPRVVLLHGAPQLSYEWRHVMRLLKDRYRLIAPDLRGYGASELAASGRYDVDILADDLRAVVDAALTGPGAGDKVRIISHDWGGPMAWRFAELYPGRIEHIVATNAPHQGAYLKELVRPRQILRSWYVAAFQIPKIEVLLQRNHASFIIRSMVRSAAPGTFSEPDLRIYRAALDRPGRVRSMVEYYRQAFGNDVREHSRKLLASPHIKVPTTIVWGEADVALSPTHPEATGEFVEHLEVRRLGGVSHWVPEERPEEVARALRESERGASHPS